MSCQDIGLRWVPGLLLWEALSLCLCWSWAGVATATADSTDGSTAAKPMDWLLSDKGPFHHSLEFTESVDKHRQGYTTRYKIYREFGRWKVNSLAVDRRDSGGMATPFDPEFMHTVRQLGRRPTLRRITDSIIKKYGTHLLLSATLGGEESLTIFVDKRKLSRGPELGSEASSHNRSGPGVGAVTLETLHQLAASYFTDRESTLRRLHHLQIASTAIRVTETRTGPLGCSNYDNLDSVSSVLVHSPENKIQLQGLQVILPAYLRSRFVQAALNYIGCNSEGQFVCRASDCWCQCNPDFPQCNCPQRDLQALENNLLHIKEAWTLANQEFEESENLWRMDGALLQRYRQLETTSGLLRDKARRAANKLFSFSKRCRHQPRMAVQRERPLRYWLSYVLSLMFCSENNQVGVFSEETRSCACPYHHPPCQGPIPCSVGEGPHCASCSTENRTRCSSCNPGFTLGQGLCRPAVPDPTDPYLGLESDRDLQDLELRYLLQRRDPRIALHGVFVSNDVRLNAWFDPSWRKRMLLTLKSNRFKSSRVHMLLGVALQVCLTKNSTLEPALSVFVNPFGGSHSESWTMPIGQYGYPDWERTKLDIPLDCYNWTVTLGNRWKSFFETVHFYLRSRVRDSGTASALGSGVAGNGTAGAVNFEPPVEGTVEPSEPAPSQSVGYMKINSMQLFGYSMHFDPDAIQDLILQLDYPYTQGSQDSALLQLVEIRYRVNRLSPPGAQPMDLFSCLLRHRLKLSSSEVTRILASLQAFSARQPNSVEYVATKLCS
ncbi:BMP/retinoic acid-inducible neural-specific protein 3 isoform X2 [Esox lucius]|uniref:BMP/retinoic acid-inducible neural-specific protein 3 isoform X2 n=1 Tax=Esox lucius TaxID=8010 RepID=UPI001476B65A|nr:BMP/retinoic acid-inducible neural-specific protein 3 isoform X2 [Esox lucius]